MTPEQWTESGERWHTLLTDVQTAIDRQVSPDSAEGRALVARWIRLGDEFTLGNPEIAQGYQRLHADEPNWPNDETAALLRSVRPKPEQQSFFNQALQACLRHG
jgi:hypothetical protein